jgi:hypothetical protein
MYAVSFVGFQGFRVWKEAEIDIDCWPLRGQRAMMHFR